MAGREYEEGIPDHQLWCEVSERDRRHAVLSGAAMRALKFRPRMADAYDPDPRFAWIVELDYRMEISDAERFKWWLVKNTTNSVRSDSTIFYGTLIGFVDHDDALLFYLTHK